jgi:hypothetical protein
MSCSCWLNVRRDAVEFWWVHVQTFCCVCRLPNWRHRNSHCSVYCLSDGSNTITPSRTSIMMQMLIRKQHIIGLFFLGLPDFAVFRALIQIGIKQKYAQSREQLPNRHKSDHQRADRSSVLGRATLGDQAVNRRETYPATHTDYETEGDLRGVI